MILYSVCGEGKGHAVRSGVVIKHILKQHNVMITAYGEAYTYLKPLFGKRVKRIIGGRFVYRNNKLAKVPTVASFILKFPFFLLYNGTVFLKLLFRKNPKLIISDYESTSHYFSRIIGIPCVDIDNIRSMTHTNISPLKRPFDVGFALGFLHPNPDLMLITYFTNLKNDEKHIKVIPPILREKIINAKTSKGEHVVVYQTSSSNKKMIPHLKRSNRIFNIYGMGKARKEGNLEFKNFNEKEFIKDMASSKYVIVNGGFTVISEALHMKKPVLSVPVENHFEQFFNAYKLRESGYGDYTEKITYSDIQSFEKNLFKFKENLKDYKQDSPFPEIDKAINKFSRS